MDWKTVGSAVKKFAPILGTALGGPVGGAAGGIISVVASALGCDPEPDAVMKAIEADPEAARKLKTVEIENATELKRIALQVDQAYLADRQDARNREVRLTESTGKRDINLYLLAWLFIIGYFGTTVLLFWLMFTGNFPEGKSLPDAGWMILGSLIATLSAGVGMVLQYFFGSSKSSQQKTQLMALANSNKQGLPTT